MIFINKFKQNYDEIKDDKKYLDYIGSQLGLGMKKNDELLHIKSKYKDELKRIKSKGEKTIVSLRPERAIINPENQMDNKHKGKIEEVIYHGDHTRVRLNLLGNKDFILKVPNSSARMDIKVGNEINVGWNSQDSRALDPKK